MEAIRAEYKLDSIFSELDKYQDPDPDRLERHLNRKDLPQHSEQDMLLVQNDRIIQKVEELSMLVRQQTEQLTAILKVVSIQTEQLTKYEHLLSIQKKTIEDQIGKMEEMVLHRDE